MNLKDLAARAKEMVDRRGGTGALKEDADELKRIAQGEGSVTDKAKAAAEALKDPGGAEASAPEPSAADEPPAASATPAERKRATAKVKGEGRGKHGGTGGDRGRGQGKRRGGGGRGQGRGDTQL